MIIGIAGLKRSGKDTVAKELLELIFSDYETLESKPLGGDMPWSLDSFAAPLRCIVADIFDLDDKYIDGYLKETQISLVRPTYDKVNDVVKHYILSVQTNNIVKGINDYLIDSRSNIYYERYRRLVQFIGTEVCRSVDDNIWVKELIFRNANSNVIVSDVRFENEAAWVRDNGVLVHVNRRSINEDMHSSEAGVEYKKGDYIINNNSTIKSLNQSVKSLYKILKEKY